LRRFIPGGRFGRSVTVLAGGAAFGQGITVLVSPVLTRLYTPDDFGVFGVYASILGIVTVVASLRYEYAIPLPEEDGVAANIVALCFVVLLGMTGLISVAIGFTGRQLVSWANAPELGPYLWLFPLGILGAGTYQILNYWAVRKRDFPRISRTRISRGVGRAVVQVGAGALTGGALGLLLGQLTGETAGSASLGLSAWKRDRAALSAVGLAPMRQAARRFRRFPLLLSWAGLLDALGLQLPQLLLAAFYGAEVAGWFALGQRAIAAPLNIVVDSVAQVFFGEAAQMSRDQPRAVKRLFFRLAKRLAVLGGLPVAVICALAPWLFGAVFGPGWVPAGRYVQVMGLMFAVRFAVIPLAHTLNVLERQDLYLAWDGLRLVLVVAALLAARFANLPDVLAVGAYAAAMLVSYLALFGFAMRALRYHHMRHTEAPR